MHISEERAAAAERVFAHYRKLFSADSPEFEALREKYAIPNSPAGGDITPEGMRNLGAFFWWTAWAAVTHRPGDSVSYTNNWPHEPLVGNAPSASAFLWTFISVVLLILGIGLLLRIVASSQNISAHSPPQLPHSQSIFLRPQRRIVPLFTEKNAPLSEINALFTKINTLFTEINALFTEIRVLFTEINALFAEKNTLFTEIRVLFTEINAPFTEIRVLFTEINAPFTEKNPARTRFYAGFGRFAADSAKKSGESLRRLSAYSDEIRSYSNNHGLIAT